MPEYIYQCDICLKYTLGKEKSANAGDCTDGGIYQFVGEQGADAAIQNLVDAIENVLIGADMSLDENRWLQSAVDYAKQIHRNGNGWEVTE